MSTPHETPSPASGRAQPGIGLELAGSVLKLVANRAYVVGSDAAADVRLVHGSVAARHARLTLQDEALLVEDLGSATGTTVAGARIDRASLHAGDVVAFGAVRACVVATPPLTIARAARPGHHEPGFHELVGAELARAPWFGLSILLHALLFLLLYWLVPARPPGQARDAPATVLAREDEELLVQEIEPEPQFEVEQAEHEVRDEARTESKRFEPELRQPEPEFDPSAFDGFDARGFGVRVGRRKGGGSGDILDLGSQALKSGAFRGTVAKLRESGLEIVFVFDSTGSMDSVLAAAKRRIFRMVEVLHALVPTARIGIVTYRDKGATEEYVTRAVPVTHDVYRVMNFMHTIHAGGGGDFEEAVLDALKTATTQRWLPQSRRVVVLIGDAPPHRQDEATLRNVIASFARGESVVHAVATTEDRRQRQPNPETRRTFEAIARDGKGQFTLLEAEDTILTQVLSLAFGAEYRRDLDEVYTLVDKRVQRTDVAALDLVRRADLAGIDKALRRVPVDDDVVKAIVTLKPVPVLRHLAEKLGDRDFPAAGRQAAAFALMQVLELRRPPLDPEAEAPVPRAEVERLLRSLR